MLAAGNASNSVGWRSIQIWDITFKKGHSQMLKRLEGHTGGVKTLSWKPSSEILASGSDDSSVRIWNASTGIQIEKFTGHQDIVNSVRWSPNGQLIASASDDKTVWILAEGELFIF
jgi:WD40 repeat protein